MQIVDLPAICIHQVTKLLAEQGMFRRSCDIVRDCVRLAATSRSVRSLFAIPLGAIVNPPTCYETLSDSATSTQLKALCRRCHLPLGGTKVILRQRLHAALQDVRLSHCHMGALFCERARIAYCRDPSIQVRTLLEALGMDLQLMQTPFTFASIADIVLSPFFGDESRLIAARVIINDSRRQSIRSRLDALQAGLIQRGCSLRDDSIISATYINDGTILGCPVTLERAMDVAEEMQFLYSHTTYRTILRGMRHLDHNRRWRTATATDTDTDEDGWQRCQDEEEIAEEGRRKIAKREAVRLWRTQNTPETVALQMPCSMSNSHLMNAEPSILFV